AGWLGRMRQALPARWSLRLALSGVALSCIAPVVAGWVPWQAALPPVLAVLLAGIWLERRLVRPIACLLEQAGAGARGHGDAHAHIDRVDELGMAARAVNQAGLNLRALIGDVAAQIQGMQLSNEQILHSNVELKRRTEQTAGQLNATSMAAQEMSNALERSAKVTNNAHELAAAARAAVTEGGRTMALLVDTMGELAQSNEHIAEMNRIIDSLASRPNLLALSAAVEAARAGNAGRGFAVGASEVRSLAQRSAEAATEIRRMVEDSVQK